MHLQYLGRWCEVVIIVIERLCVGVQFMGDPHFRSRRCRTLNFILRSNYKGDLKRNVHVGNTA